MSLIRRGRRFRKTDDEAAERNEISTDDGKNTTVARRNGDDFSSKERTREEEYVRKTGWAKESGMNGNDAGADDDGLLRTKNKNENSLSKGTRAGANSKRLISTGSIDLDDILGGGVPLNSTFGVFSYTSCEVANVFARLFLSEGFASAQKGLWIVSELLNNKRDEREGLVRLIRTTTKADGSIEATASEKNDVGSKSTTTTTTATNDGLKIAWQYRKYMNDKETRTTNNSNNRGKDKESLVNSKKKKNVQKLQQFCHDFDITQAYTREEALSIPVDVIACDVCDKNISKTFARVVAFGNSLVQDENNHEVGRILIQPPRALLDDPTNEKLFKNYIALLHAVKGFVQQEKMEHRIALFLLFPPKALLSKTKLSDLRQVCDCFVETSSLLNPEFGFDDNSTAIESVLPEPTINCVALLTLGKKLFPGALAGGFGTVDSTFAVQRRGKRYAIKPLAQRPEDHDTNNDDKKKKINGSSGSSSKNSSSAGGAGLCSRKPAEDPLDF